jgi:glutaryl-CoA dehydrogenase (non-decarboxylating)
MSADELRQLREVVRDFGSKEIRPVFRELEQAGAFPRQIYRNMGELGFFGCIAPEALGGNGAGYQALAVIAEEIAYAYPPLSASMNLQAATVPLTIANWGRPDVAERYVPGLVAGDLIGYNAMSEADGGSDFLGAMRTRAERRGDHYVINGSKMWITNANVADVGIVYCKTDPSQRHKGVSAFVVETNTAGFASQRVKCSALGSLMPTNGLTFDDMRVSADSLLGAEGAGFTVAMNAMDFGRLSVAARSLGLARACLDESVTYANQRMAFGKKIGHFQMVKQQIADMTCEVAAVRALVAQAAQLYDDGSVPTRESSIAKYYAGEVCNRAAQAASEIFGGYAFSDELPISIFLNYAKLWQTGEGSANIQAVLIADDALGWKPMDRHATSGSNHA